MTSLMPPGDLRFSESLLQKNAHTKRRIYKDLPTASGFSSDRKGRAYKSVLRCHPDAMELGSPRGEFVSEKGNASFWLLLIGLMGVVFLVASIAFATAGSFWITILCLGWTYVLFCLFMVQRRAFYKQPIDDPVLFDRKRRVVIYRPLIRGGFFRFWREATHGDAREFSWDSHVRARVYKFAHAMGAEMATVSCVLTLLFIDDNEPDLVVDIVEIGTHCIGIDVSQVALWEHICCYMDRGGPAIESPLDMRNTDLNRVPAFPGYAKAPA